MLDCLIATRESANINQVIPYSQLQMARDGGHAKSTPLNKLIMASYFATLVRFVVNSNNSTEAFQDKALGL